MRNAKWMFWYYLLRSKKLQTIPYARGNQCGCTISQGLKPSKRYESQCRINVLVALAEVREATDCSICKAKSICWHRLLRSETFQNLSFALQGQWFDMIDRWMIGQEIQLISNVWEKLLILLNTIIPLKIYRLCDFQPGGRHQAIFVCNQPAKSHKRLEKTSGNDRHEIHTCVKRFFRRRNKSGTSYHVQN